jgi:glycosyltransferase involved in cell wall biosynthesis
MLILLGIVYLSYVYYNYVNFNVQYKKKDILIVSDSVHICGVTRKYNEICKRLLIKYDIVKLDTSMFPSYSMPIWNDVKFCMPGLIKYLYMREIIIKNNPDKIHIMTEGPLGFMVMIYCIMNNIKYTTMFCTRIDLYFEENIHKWCGCVVRWYFRQFHKNSKCIIVPSPSMINIIKDMTGNDSVKSIMNGCDLTKFGIHGETNIEMDKLKKPIWLNVGRLCKSKGIQDIFNISHRLPGTVVIVGGGKNYLEYKHAYPHIKFLGWKEGNDLYNCYRSADYFIFPSKTDTFGQVIVEAMASGLPVAAYPVTGPKDIIIHEETGYLHEDLDKSCKEIMNLNCRKRCIEHSKNFTWNNMVNEFIKII